MATYTIHWPDGSTTRGRSATEAIFRLSTEQRPPMSFQAMKDALSARAKAWPFGTRQFVHPAQPDAPFLRELARVGLFELEIDKEKAT